MAVVPYNSDVLCMHKTRLQLMYTDVQQLKMVQMVSQPQLFCGLDQLVCCDCPSVKINCAKFLTKFHTEGNNHSTSLRAVAPICPRLVCLGPFKKRKVFRSSRKQSVQYSDMFVFQLVLLTYFFNPIPIEIKLIGFKDRFRRRAF